MCVESAWTRTVVSVVAFRFLRFKVGREISLFFPTWSFDILHSYIGLFK